MMDEGAPNEPGQAYRSECSTWNIADKHASVTVEECMWGINLIDQEMD